MLSLIPFVWRRLEPASAASITFSFWALAILSHIKLQSGVIEPLVIGAMLLCCLLMLGFVGARWWKSIGTPGALLLTAIASYFFIAVGVSLATNAELPGEDVARQVFFFVVTLSAILGGRWLLERIGFEALLKWMLALLMASCVVILASPILRDIGALPEYRLPYRMTGTFTDPNDAGFIGCMTVALGLAFQFNGPQRPLGYLALALGCAAVFSSISNTSAIVMGVLVVLFLLLNIPRLRQNLLRTGLSLACMAGVLVWLAINLQGFALFQQPESNIGDAHVSGGDGEKKVGAAVSVYLVNDKIHRADDNPVSPWRWQRANPMPSDANTPDDATWTDIAGIWSYRYVPLSDDIGKFLRAHTSYEKEGVMRRASTPVIGPIVDTPVTILEKANENIATAKGETSGSALQNRIELWRIGAEMALESPIVGHGFYQLHHYYMDGVHSEHQEKPPGVHNIYLMLVGESGIIPLALYVLALFFLIRALWTMPKSLVRDSIVGWVVVMALFGVTFHHWLTMGTSNFLIGLTCAMAAFLIHRQRGATSAR